MQTVLAYTYMHTTCTQHTRMHELARHLAILQLTWSGGGDVGKPRRRQFHHTNYVTSSYILCHIIIHAMSHHHTYCVTSSYILCHIIIHTMSHHHTYYVTSSYTLCHIIIHTTSPSTVSSSSS